MEDKITVKAKDMLLQIRSNMLASIQQRARNIVEYNKGDKPDEMLELFGNIANPAKWDYCGLLSKQDITTLEVLEYLLNDNQDKISRYKEWKP